MAQTVFYPKTITINITSFKGAWRLEKVLKASTEAKLVVRRTTFRLVALMTLMEGHKPKGVGQIKMFFFLQAFLEFLQVSAP